MLMDRLLLRRNTKILASILKKVKMLIHHVFIHSSIFFNWSLPSLLNETKGQGSVEVSCPWRGACVRKSSLGHCPCKAGNKNCNANCQCHWHSWNEVTKLKLIKHPAVQYFSIFLFKIKKILIRKCSSFIYNP